MWWHDNADPRTGRLERTILDADLTPWGMTRTVLEPDAFNHDDKRLLLAEQLLDPETPFHGGVLWADRDHVPRVVIQSGRGRYDRDLRPHLNGVLASRYDSGMMARALLRLERRPRGTWLTGTVELMTGLGHTAAKPVYRERIPEDVTPASFDTMLHKACDATLAEYKERTEHQ